LKIQKGLSFYHVHSGLNASKDEVALASSPPTFLKIILGGYSKRKSLLSRRINWDRVLFISEDEEVVGYLQYYLRGKGPHAPSYKDMVEEYGALGALWRFPVYYLLEKRFKRSEAYLYRVVIKDSFRSRGLGKILIEKWLYLMDEQGLDTVELEVWGRNFKAKKLYLSLGFEVVSVFSLPYQGRVFQNGKLIRMARKHY